jgi:hypothetical protein
LNCQKIDDIDGATPFDGDVVQTLTGLVGNNRAREMCDASGNGSDGKSDGTSGNSEDDDYMKPRML